jgi:proline iminopeptidase
MNTKRRRSVAILIGVVVLVTASVAVVAARRFMERPMFEPGSAGRRVVAAGERLDPPSGATVEGGWQVAPGVTLHHFEAGRGEDVIVVHGGPGIAPEHPWRAAEHLPDLRLHFYHQRGCGLSTRPLTAPPEGSTYRRMVAAEARLGLAEQIADLERIRRLLGRERIVLFGHSFGALIAALYAAEFPERVRALVLVAPAPLFELPVPGGDLFASIRARLPAAMRPQLDAYVEEAFDFPALTKLDERQLSALAGRLAPLYAAASEVPWRADGSGAAAPGGWMQLGVYLSLGRRHDWRGALRAVTAPVLVIHGERDLQPRAASEGVARLFAAGRLSVVPRAGHFVFDDEPAAFAKAVREFMGTLPGAETTLRSSGTAERDGDPRSETAGAPRSPCHRSSTIAPLTPPPPAPAGTPRSPGTPPPAHSSRAERPRARSRAPRPRSASARPPRRGTRSPPRRAARCRPSRR